MFIDTMDKFAELHAKREPPGVRPDGRRRPPGLQRRIAGQRATSRGGRTCSGTSTSRTCSRGVHDHLMFGEGEVDFADVFAGLRAANYAGGVYVELSRHSHDAVNTARKAKAFLDPYLH